VGFDTDLKQTLEAIADRAPDPHRLRSELRARARARRQRRALLTAGASAIGAAAVGVPAFVWLTKPPAPLPISDGGPGLTVPLTLRPTWLPSEVVATSRFVEVPSLYELQSFSDTTYGEVSVDLSLGPWTGVRPEWESNADVNGTPAFLRPLDGSTVISWPRPDGLLATVQVRTGGRGGSAADVATRVARSVVSDGRAVCTISMRFAAMPDSASVNQFSVSEGGQPGRFSQRLVCGDLTANLGPDGWGSPSGEVAEAVIVRGRPGFMYRPAPYPEGGERATTPRRIVVNLADGRWLCVDGDGTNAEPERLVQVTNDMIIGPDPVLPWLGHGV
jgi:hypothetical protein